MLSLYRVSPNIQKTGQKISNTNLDDNSNREHYVQRRQMTSKDLKRHQVTSLSLKQIPNFSLNLHLSGEIEIF